ncbi:DNA polymerase III subunit delta [Natronospirillum operosum]|uniref:DNA polymerase III subunit delta n=1 Tax=Natronospirillum operosum TaxID=2759953 RepID=A0A4Z0W545_9GAMM|nr:DNA polymerase III subunit delta [Natronospirillum operosum]TGG92762.1 DNA polymerase III subunit delta [Natronospirillum operosum]
MDIRPEQLSGHLQQDWKPIYVVTGQEPLLIEEALDQIRARARELGFTERRILHADAQFDWSELVAANQAMSLFSDRQIIEVQLERKPDKAGQVALAEYAASPHPDNLLLISGAVLDNSSRKAKWFRTLSQPAGVITAWPVGRQQLPGWLTQRARLLGLQLEPEAVELLAERTDGNLLAARQELQKLSLLFDQAPITTEQVLDAVVDNARFSVFDLVDALHAGDLARSQRILDSLQSEGVEPLVIQWTLTREARTLMALQGRLRAGESPANACQALRIFRQRQILAQQAANRVRPARWQGILALLQRTDSAVKGSEPLSPWLLLGQIVWRWAG